MTTLLRIVFAFTLVVALAWTIHWASVRFGVGLCAGRPRDAMQQAPGTVVAVTNPSSGKPAADSAGPVRVCFTIDSFDGLSEEFRSLYQVHENARAAADGPLCEIALVPADTPAPAAGDHIEVYFMLQDGGGITPVKFRRKGVDLPIE